MDRFSPQEGKISSVVTGRSLLRAILGRIGAETMGPWPATAQVAKAAGAAPPLACCTNIFGGTPVRCAGARSDVVSVKSSANGQCLGTG
jgi:hypothetical protein